MINFVLTCELLEFQTIIVELRKKRDKQVLLKSQNRDIHLH